MLGWANNQDKQGEEGIELIREAIADWRASGAELVIPQLQQVLAAALARGESYQEALLAIEEALGVISNTGDRSFEADCWRWKGELYRELWMGTIPASPKRKRACIKRLRLRANRRRSPWNCGHTPGSVPCWHEEARPRERMKRCQRSMAGSKRASIPTISNTPSESWMSCTSTSVPAEGSVSLGTEVNVLPAAIETVRSRGGLVIAQLNPQVPYTYGDSVLSADDIDYAIETDVPLPVPPQRPSRDSSASIGDRVAALVRDGATLQLGIGAVPDAVLAALCGRRGLTVWSEMFSDGVLALHKAGALDPGHPITASFAFGSMELYDWMDRNPGIAMLRTETTNDPARIEQRPRMVSVNTALEVDLFAQANASRVHGLIYSGFGGQTDFVVGALHSPGGLAIIALPSWHPKANVSTVVPRLAGPVTSFQHSFIVSDQGTAAIWGHDAAAQAEQIITQVAHPSARDGLREAGRRLGFQL